MPTEEEVIKAYSVLGVGTGSTLSEVRKRYVDLAKEHHPDVASASASQADTTGSATSRMVDINNAYNTVNRFHKAGRKLTSQGTSASSGTGGYGGSASYWHAGHTQRRQQQQHQQSYYTTQDRGYQPWYEDLDPLLYEMMWEELRRQNDRDPFEQAMHPDEFCDHGETHGAATSNAASGGSYRPHRQSQRPSQGQKGVKEKEKVKTTTWPDTDLQAMVNMYQDGKSFEFIGNALGKKTTDVVDQFNKWSDDNKKNRRGNGDGGRSGGGGSRYQHNRNGRRRYNARRTRGPFYHMEYPTGPPYGFYNYMVDDIDADDDVEDDPYGYYAGDDYGYYDDPWQVDEDEGPTAFTGTHHMSGASARPHTHMGGSTSSGSASSRYGAETSTANGGGGGGVGGAKKRSKFFKNNHHNSNRRPNNRNR